MRSVTAGRVAAITSVAAAISASLVVGAPAGRRGHQKRPTGSAVQHALALARDQAAGNTSSADQRIALVARNAADGGVWAAYAVGYPTAQSIRVLKVGTSIARTIRVGGNVRFVSLSAGPGGRL